MNKSIILDRMTFLMAVRRLMQVSPSSYNSVVMIEEHEGKMMLSAFGNGLTAIEILPGKLYESNDQVVIDLRKLYVFLQNVFDSDISITISPSNVKLVSGNSKATISRSMVVRMENVPDKKSKIGEISRTALDDLTRVSNISDSKNSPRPLLNGVMFILEPGSIKTVSTNGMSIGYAWEINGNIDVVPPGEKMLIPAEAVQVIQKYDWQGEDRLSIYRHGNSICFSNGFSYVFAVEFEGKSNYPDKQLITATLECKSKYWFKTDLLLLKSAIEAAVNLAEYKENDDRSILVSLINQELFVVSGREMPGEIESRGQVFKGYSTVLTPVSSGTADFEFCLNAQYAKLAIGLLAQVDKGGMLHVSVGEQNRMVFFRTSTVDAVYAVLQIYKE